ncbi:MAG TPA: response regulator [Steroidobacteraceae bacterium]|nr:response regulator [Steroidobacteraceae bacterium]
MDIALYDQDDLTRALLQEWLSGAKYRVRVGLPQEADLGLPADLIIVDVYMPKQAGARHIRELRARHPDTPIIAISAQFRSGLCSAGATAQALGVQQVIAKPLVRGDLLGAVRAIIGAPD